MSWPHRLRRLRRADRHRRAVGVEIPDGQADRHHRPQRLRQVHAAEALARLLKPRGGAVLLDGRSHPRAAAARGGPAARACCRSRRSCPRGSRSPTSWRADGSRTRRWWRQWSAEDQAAVADGPGRAGRHRPRRPPRRRAVRRAAAAGLDRDGAGPGDRGAAARRADDLPRPRAPGRCAGPVAPPARAAGRTVVAVLHDLNQAARYADHVIAMRTAHRRRRARRPTWSPPSSSRRVRPRMRVIPCHVPSPRCRLCVVPRKGI